jgi:hypothetical protein
MATCGVHAHIVVKLENFRPTGFTIVVESRAAMSNEITFSRRSPAGGALGPSPSVAGRTSSAAANPRWIRRRGTLVCCFADRGPHDPNLVNLPCGSYQRDWIAIRPDRPARVGTSRRRGPPPGTQPPCAHFRPVAGAVIDARA